MHPFRLSVVAGLNRGDRDKYLDTLDTNGLFQVEHGDLFGGLSGKLHLSRWLSRSLDGDSNHDKMY